MDRLTKRAANGMPYLVKVKQNEQELEGSYDTLKCVQDAFEALAQYEEKIESGELIERIYCKDCKESSQEDEHRVYCGLKGCLSNRFSFCEAMEK